MSADVRTVATDALETLGTIITENEKRDAIHLAVEPVTAGEKLYPGQDIGFHNGLAVAAPREANDVVPLGIVDPFLDQWVNPGDHFWLVVYPRKINSLRHVWTCPGFPDNELVNKPNPDKTEFELAREWIVNYAHSLNSEYSILMDHAVGYLRDGEYWDEGDRFEGEYIPDEFWTNYNIIMKPKFPVATGNFFSCSC